MKPIRNAKARYDYEIQEKLEAGIVLFGPEVKSIKSGRAKLDGGFAVLHGNELFLTNVHVPQYQQNQPNPPDPERSRKLLIKRKDMERLIGTMKSRGLTIIPLSLYSKGGLVKVELGIGRGKRTIDKRKSIKERDITRSMQRRMRQKT